MTYRVGDKVFWWYESAIPNYGKIYNSGTIVGVFENKHVVNLDKGIYDLNILPEYLLSNETDIKMSNFTEEQFRQRMSIDAWK